MIKQIIYQQNKDIDSNIYLIFTQIFIKYELYILLVY